MTTTTKGIKASGLFFLMTTLGTTFKVITLPSLLAETAGRDLWLSVVLMLLADVLIVAVFLTASALHKDLTMSQILDKTVGKTASTIIMLVFACFGIFRLYFMFMSMQKYMTFSLYNNLPWTPFTLPISILLAYTAYSGLRSITRTNQLFSYVTLAVMLLSTTLFLLNTDFSAFLPVLENGVYPAANGAGRYFLAFGDYLPLLLFLGRTQPSKGLKHATIWGAVASAFICLGICIAFYSFYQNISSLQFQGQILTDMGQSFKGSDTFSRFDVVIVVAWLVSGFLNLVVRNWAVKQTVFDGLRLRETRLNNFFAALPSFVIVTVLNLVLLSFYPVTNTHFTAWWRFAVGIPIICGVPLLLLVACLICRRKNVKAV